MEVVLFITMYLMVCIVAAVWAGYERTIGFPLSFLFCVVLTPVLGVPLTMFFKKLPMVCCMKDFKDFSTGCCYYFRKKYRDGQWYYYVQHASSHCFNEILFNKCFSIVVKDREHVADAIAEVR